MTAILIVSNLVSPAGSVSIGLQDICGNKLVGSCPAKISLKVVGGDSSCAEKVPWNVLVELVTGPEVKAAGNRTIIPDRKEQNTSTFLGQCTLYRNYTTRLQNRKSLFNILGKKF